jgi:hypothetical protein
MKTLLALLILSGLAAPAAAQTASPNPMTAPIPSPFQALGNITRNPNAPPPPQPRQVTSQPPLPTIIPPHTIGTYRGW